MPHQCQICHAPCHDFGHALKCGHIFHYDCVKRAVEQNGQCPFRCQINRQDDFLKVIFTEYYDSYVDEIRTFENLNGAEKVTINNLQHLLNSGIGKLQLFRYLIM
jgi:hypothetical protein